jgi:cholestenol Delta-isomerase
MGSYSIVMVCCAGKEYSKADSRYVTRDAFVVAMEAVTAFVEGPACFAVVYGLLYHKAWAQTTQLLVSAGQLYGDVLYFATCMLEGEDARGLTSGGDIWGGGILLVPHVEPVCP